LAAVTPPSAKITRVGDGMYRVEHEGHNEIVYVAGPAGDRWIFWNGRVFYGEQVAGLNAGPNKVRSTSVRPTSDKVRPASARPTAQSLTAPMPARVSRILVQPGATIKKGATVIVLEAMKMELPVRALADATVVTVHCREGELVQADAVLIDLE
jgi:biotin carboxyl carrier protein